MSDKRSDTKRTIPVQVMLKPETVATLQALQLFFGRGMGSLIEDAVLQRLPHWRGVVAGSMKDGEALPDGLDLGALQLQAVHLGRAARRKRERQGKSSAVAGWQKS
jgi:hypothetical protein